MWEFARQDLAGSNDVCIIGNVGLKCSRDFGA